MARVQPNAISVYCPPMARSLPLLLFLAVVVTGCATLDPQGGTQTVSVDRSWFAVVDAFADEGLRVIHEDRAAGLIEGEFKEIIVSVRVEEQDDGNVRVDFVALGEREKDPGLLQRVVRAYNRQMGR